MESGYYCVKCGEYFLEEEVDFGLVYEEMDVYCGSCEEEGTLIKK